MSRLLLIIVSFATFICPGLCESSQKEPGNLFIEFYKVATKGDLSKAKKYLSSNSTVDIKEYLNYITKGGKIEYYTVYAPRKPNKNDTHSYIIGIAFPKDEIRHSYALDEFIKNMLDKIKIGRAMDGKKIHSVIIDAQSIGQKITLHFVSEQYFHEIPFEIPGLKKKVEGVCFLIPFFFIKEEGKWKIEVTGIPKMNKEKEKKSIKELEKKKEKSPKTPKQGLTESI